MWYCIFIYAVEDDAIGGFILYSSLSMDFWIVVLEYLVLLWIIQVCFLCCWCFLIFICDLHWFSDLICGHLSWYMDWYVGINETCWLLYLFTVFLLMFLCLTFQFIWVYCCCQLFFVRKSEMLKSLKLLSFVLLILWNFLTLNMSLYDHLKCWSLLSWSLKCLYEYIFC